jgi:hypothetical protein
MTGSPGGKFIFSTSNLWQQLTLQRLCLGQLPLVSSTSSARTSIRLVLSHNIGGGNHHFAQLMAPPLVLGHDVEVENHLAQLID